MLPKIVLFNKSRVQVGTIVRDGARIMLDVNKTLPEETVSELSVLLKDLFEEGAIKLRSSERRITSQDTVTHVERSEKVLVDDPRFLPALADRINHAMSSRKSVFALVVPEKA